MGEEVNGSAPVTAGLAVASDAIPSKDTEKKEEKDEAMDVAETKNNNDVIVAAEVKKDVSESLDGQQGAHPTQQKISKSGPPADVDSEEKTVPADVKEAKKDETSSVDRDGHQNVVGEEHEEELNTDDLIETEEVGDETEADVSTAGGCAEGAVSNANVEETTAEMVTDNVVNTASGTNAGVKPPPAKFTLVQQCRVIRVPRAVLDYMVHFEEDGSVRMNLTQLKTSIALEMHEMAKTLNSDDWRHSDDLPVADFGIPSNANNSVIVRTFSNEPAARLVEEARIDRQNKVRDMLCDEEVLSMSRKMRRRTWQKVINDGQGTPYTADNLNYVENMYKRGLDHRRASGAKRAREQAKREEAEKKRKEEQDKAREQADGGEQREAEEKKPDCILPAQILPAVPEPAPVKAPTTPANKKKEGAGALGGNQVNSNNPGKNQRKRPNNAVGKPANSNPNNQQNAKKPRGPDSAGRQQTFPKKATPQSKNQQQQRGRAGTAIRTPGNNAGALKWNNNGNGGRNRRDSSMGGGMNRGGGSIMMMGNNNNNQWNMGGTGGGASVLDRMGLNSNSFSSRDLMSAAANTSWTTNSGGGAMGTRNDSIPWSSSGGAATTRDEPLEAMMRRAAYEQQLPVQAVPPPVPRSQMDIGGGGGGNAFASSNKPSLLSTILSDAFGGSSSSSNAYGNIGRDTSYTGSQSLLNSSGLYGYSDKQNKPVADMEMNMNRFVEPLDGGPIGGNSTMGYGSGGGGLGRSSFGSAGDSMMGIDRGSMGSSAFSVSQLGGSSGVGGVRAMDQGQYSSFPSTQVGGSSIGGMGGYGYGNSTQQMSNTYGNFLNNVGTSRPQSNNRSGGRGSNNRRQSGGGRQYDNRR